MEPGASPRVPSSWLTRRLQARTHPIPRIDPVGGQGRPGQASPLPGQAGLMAAGLLPILLRRRRPPPLRSGRVLRAGLRLRRRQRAEGGCTGHHSSLRSRFRKVSSCSLQGAALGRGRTFLHRLARFLLAKSSAWTSRRRLVLLHPGPSPPTRPPAGVPAGSVERGSPTSPGGPGQSGLPASMRTESPAATRVAAANVRGLGHLGWRVVRASTSAGGGALPEGIGRPQLHPCQELAHGQGGDVQFRCRPCCPGPGFGGGSCPASQRKRTRAVPGPMSSRSPWSRAWRTPTVTRSGRSRGRPRPRS